VHRVRHTGKLARLVVLDLALLDATGEAGFWDGARRRAAEVAGCLAPDPEHGALVYFPGRLDPRNCSNSAIDSGECTDALGRLLLHPRAATLPAEERRRIEQTVAGNAGTYLADKLPATAITNQRLWGAMGLATAARWRPQPSWVDAVRGAVTSALAEQRPDGSWGYEPEAKRHGAAGASDLTVYYHSRCLAFLYRIVDCLPELETPAVDAALRRGGEFLAAVVTPDGRKPLALEGKRWFWASAAEAGSNAFDVFALHRGAARFGRPAWRDLAARSWWQLRRHQAADGSVVAGDRPDTPDFVCPTFHTADTAWTAQVLESLRDETAAAPAAGAAPRVSHFPDAGLLRLESDHSVVLLRTSKRGRNTQWGGGIGGGTLIYAGDTARGADRLRPDREAPETAAAFTLYPARPARPAAAQRFRRADPPGREGRQWLFVARLLLAQGRPGAAASRLWKGYLRPLLWSLADPAATHWATRVGVETLPDGRLRLSGQPARTGGDVPDWAAGVTFTREVWLAPDGGEGQRVRVIDRLAREEAGGGAGGDAGLVVYRLPHAAGDVRLAGSQPLRRSGRDRLRVELRPAGAAFFLRVAFCV
jgi:hypothetical protein